MTPSSDCLDLIRTFEGLQLKAYRCPAGVATIGYGSTGPDIHIGLTWTLDQAKARLASDVTKFSRGVSKIAGTPSQHQFDALVAFAYNVGLGALRGSTLLKLHLEGNHEAAAKQFTRWTKVDGKVLSGLVNRRAAEAKLYLS